MINESIGPLPTSVDDLMQAMTHLNNLSIAPDTAPVQSTINPSSLRDMRVQRAIDEYPGLTREKAAEINERFGF